MACCRHISAENPGKDPEDDSYVDWHGNLLVVEICHTWEGELVCLIVGYSLHNVSLHVAEKLSMKMMSVLVKYAHLMPVRE